MSDKPTLPQRASRSLRQDEIALIQSPLLRVPSHRSIALNLEDFRVVDMADGGMGSIRFDGPDHRKLGAVPVEADYVDSDGLLLKISLNLDDQNNLFEVDFWKVDFSPLNQYPKPYEVKY